MPKLPALRSSEAPMETFMSPRPRPAEGDGGVFTEAWLEELDGLLRAYHDHLYARLDRRLEAAVVQLKEHSAVAGAVVRPRRPTMTPFAAPGAKQGQTRRWGSDMVAKVQSERSIPSSGAKQGQERSSGSMLTVAKVQTDGSVQSNDSARADLDQEDLKLQKKATRVSVLHRIYSGDPDDDLRPAWSVGRFVEHPWFDSFFAVMILTNAIFIAVQTDLAARSIAPESHAVFFTISVVYTLIFTVEVVCRMAAHGWRFFISSENWAWNSLDVFVVVVSLIEVVLDILVRMTSDAFGDAYRPTQFRILRILRVTRVVRLIRVTRIIRLIRALRTLVHQIMSALRSLVWALLLLLILIFLFAVLFTQATTSHRLQGDGGPKPLRFDLEADALTTHWSTLPRSMYTLFKAITGGVSWQEVSQPLSDIDQLWVMVFLAYICFAQMAVLNVLTGVFCQNAIDSAAHDQDLVTQSVLANKRLYVNQIQGIFKDIDADNSGSITIQEFKDHLENERMRAYFASLGLDTSDVWTLFKLLDTDKGSVIEFDEFVSGCLRLKGQAKGVDLAKLSYEHSWMAKRLAKFMQRTDEALSSLIQAAPGTHHDRPQALEPVDGSMSDPLA